MTNDKADFTQGNILGKLIQFMLPELPLQQYLPRR